MLDVQPAVAYHDGALAVRVAQLEHAVHMPGTERLLLRAAVGPGMRVADLGCGRGAVALWLAEKVGRLGAVVGVDTDASAVAAAAKAATALGLDNTRFIVADARRAGLERGSFDVVYVRFVLFLLNDPIEAIRSISELIKPGGLLVAEEPDFDGPYSVPVSPAFDRCVGLCRAALGDVGADLYAGAALHRIVLDAGFPACDVAVDEPLVKNGDAKRYFEALMLQHARTLEEAGHATQKEIEATAAEMRRLAADPTTHFGMLRVTQVRARKA